MKQVKRAKKRIKQVMRGRRIMRKVTAALREQFSVDFGVRARAWCDFASMYHFEFGEDTQHPLDAAAEITESIAEGLS